MCHVSCVGAFAGGRGVAMRREKIVQVFLLDQKMRAQKRFEYSDKYTVPVLLVSVCIR
jgi:hypothetical protein